MLKYIKVVGFNLVTKPLRYQAFLYSQRNSLFVQGNDAKVKDELRFTNNFQSQRNEALEKAFENVNSISLLLKTATSTHKIQYALKAIDLLADWSKRDTIDLQEVVLDENYEKFVSLIEKKGIYLHVEDTIKALQSLQKIGFEGNNFLIETLQNDLLWSVRKVSIRSLLSILAFQHKHKETERQKKVVEEAVSAIETRWTEVAKPKEFLMIYSLSNHFSSDFLENIDDLLAEKVADIRVDTLADIILAISYSKRRSMPLLRSLGYQMFKQGDILPPDKIKNVLFALDSLNFHDDALLGKLSEDFLNQISYVKEPSIIGTVAYCVGHMHWKDNGLMDALVKWVIDNINLCRPNDVVSLILSLATLNHTPANIEELIKASNSQLNFSLITKNRIVDIVWALTVLGQVTNEQIASVLEPSFVSNFSIDNTFHVGTFLKLLNINAAAQLIYTSYSGPKLQLKPNDFEKLLMTQNRDNVNLHNHVSKILHNFLPPKYVREYVKSDFGFTVDAELIVDKNGRPMDLTDYPSNLALQEETKALPKGFHRIAVMVWSYKDYNKGLLSITGFNAFTLQLLSKRGYKVVEIPYFEVNKSEKSLKTVQSIEKKIQECVM